MKAVEERKKLEKLLDNTPDELEANSSIDADELTQEPVLNIDFESLRDKCNYEARIMLNNSIAIFLDDNIKDDEYVKNKLEVDVMSLSGMIYQLRVNEDMQKAIMKEVDKGLINPRMFEVFTGMSRQIAELNKQLLATVEAIKSTYKDLKLDFREKQHELTTALNNVPEIGTGSGAPTQQNILTTSDGSYVTMGTKDIIKSMRSQRRTENMNAEDIVDIKSIE
jgi:hypothetical protein